MHKAPATHQYNNKQIEVQCYAEMKKGNEGQRCEIFCKGIADI